MPPIQLRSVSSLVNFFRKRAFLFRLTCFSLFYNVHLSWSYVMDTMMEPAFWVVDTFTGLLGPLFVIFVAILKISVVLIAYVVGLPYYLSHSVPLSVFLVTFGQFFFVNVVFNYWKALTIGPGTPPMEINGHQIVSICKKCISPKPPRTHHCSVCDKCILKMDHHCPWLNNCVGHWNHRFFFLYMVYTVLGCVFLMTFGFQILYEEVFGSERDETVYFFGFVSRHALIIYEAFLVTSCFLILGGLCIWHAKLITKGETSIEAHINRSETKRLKEQGKVYANPYDFTPWFNWCLFLGMIDGRGWSSVLLPSGHLPKGNGLEWDTIYECDVKWNEPLMIPRV